MAVLQRGREGEVYNIGGNYAITNREVIGRILRIVGAPEPLIRRVTDRPGHDRRYALCSKKVRRETDFVPEIDFDCGLAETVQWYRDNTAWTGRVRSNEYREYYRMNYEWRSITETVAMGVTTEARHP